MVKLSQGRFGLSLRKNEKLRCFPSFLTLNPLNRSSFFGVKAEDQLSEHDKLITLVTVSYSSQLSDFLVERE